MKKLICYLLVYLFCQLIPFSAYAVVVGYSRVAGGADYSDIIYYHNADALGDATKSAGSATVSYPSGLTLDTTTQILGVGSWTTDGTDWDRAEIPLSSNFDLVSGRIGFYGRIETGSSSQYLINTNVSSDLYLQWQGTNLKLVFRGNATSSSALSESTIYFFELAINGTTCTLYVDGVEDNTSTGTDTITSTTLIVFRGNSTPNIDATVDQIISSNDETRDIYAIKDITDFN